jgi:endogenous inhibitor of DNA gyrase (YacG/DUF329 family)
MSVRCPICRKEFEPEHSPAMPFCSHRCKCVDLGRWLGERYGVPEESEEESQAAAEPEALDEEDAS